MAGVQGPRVQLWWSSLWVPQGLLQLRSSCGHLRRDSAELPAPFNTAPGHFAVCWDTGNTGQQSAAMAGTAESTTKAGYAETQPGCGEPRGQKLIGSSLAVAWLEDQAVWGAPSDQSPCSTPRSVFSTTPRPQTPGWRALCPGSSKWGLQTSLGRLSWGGEIRWSVVSLPGPHTQPGRAGQGLA